MRLYQTRVRASLVFAALIGACRNSTEPSVIRPTPDIVNGTWAEEDEVVGSFMQWSLLVRDTVVTGTGGWSAEACCGGHLTIVGYTSGGALHLSITSPGSPVHVTPPTDSATHYVAVLLSPTEMSVAQSTDPTTTEFRMHKQ
jgi:hypothetical protein